MISPRVARAALCPAFAAGAHWPVDGGVREVPRLGRPSCGFGAARTREILGVRLWTHWHCGVDLEAVAGQPIVAVGDGIVVSAHPFYRSLNGRLTYATIVRHERCQVLYGETDRPRCAVGSVVRVGQVLGLAAAMVTPMLHVECYALGVDAATRRARRKLTWRGRDAPPPPGLLNPTGALVDLAGR